MSFDSGVRFRLRHLRRAAAAAARLSAVYALGVVVLAVSITLWTRELIIDPSDVLEAIVALSLFLLCSSFLSLIIFRRFAMRAVLVALIAVWVYGPLRWAPEGVLWGFVLWSIIAMPMYLMTVLAYPSQARSRMRRMIPGALISFWLGLAAVVLVVLPLQQFMFTGDCTCPPPPAVFFHAAGIVFGPTPFLIAIEALYRIERVQSQRLRSGNTIESRISSPIDEWILSPPRCTQSRFNIGWGSPPSCRCWLYR